MLDKTSNQNELKIPEGIPIKPRVINVTAYDLLWQAADDIQRRFLHLAFRLEIANDGWTVDGYTLTEIHALMQYPPTGDKRDTQGKLVKKGSRTRLQEIIEAYKEAGVIKTHPPKGHRRRFWFAFVIDSDSDLPSQRQFEVSQAHNSGEPGTQSTPDRQCEPGTPSESGNESRALFKSEPGTHSMRAGHTIAHTTDLEEEDSIKLDPSTKDHLLLAHERVMERLNQIGIDGPALEKAKTLPAADLETILENVEAGVILGEVESKARMIAFSILKGNSNNRTYIIQLEKRRQIEAAKESHLHELEALAATQIPDADLPLEPVVEIIQDAREADLADERRIRAAMKPDLVLLPRGSKSNYKDCWSVALNDLSHRLHRAEFNNAFARAELIGLLDEDERCLVVQVQDYYAKSRAISLLYQAQHVFRQFSGELLAIKFVSPESKTALDQSAVSSFAPAPLRAAG